jgi:signal transduction histidine kinase
MILIPVLALVSVGVAMTYSNRSTLSGDSSFTVLPVQRTGVGGLRSPGEDNFAIDVVPGSNPVTVGEGNRRLIYEPETGRGYLIEANEGFFTAYRRERQSTLDTLNRNLAIGVAVVAVLAAGIAFWLSRRVLGPVDSLTAAVGRMEEGDLSQRVHITSRDEIGHLGSAFNSMAESLERNETLRRTLTSDVAHELRTPLNNISGYLDAVADGVVQPDDAIIESLQEEAGLLVRLVNDLEQLSLADAGHQQLLRELVSLEEVVERAIQAVTPRAANKGVTLRGRFEGVLPQVEADPVRIGQVVRNLLENAVTHTPPGGAVTVVLEPDNDHVRLSVADTGGGIPPEHLPFIFERFYRADASRARATGGAGIGLAIVKQLTEAHGGEVSAENVPGAGARFNVTLPLPATP